MNGEMLAVIGQLAPVIVGIPSLICLAVQIRGQTKERRQSAVNAFTLQWGSLTRALHENAEFPAIYLRGLHSLKDLDPISKLRLARFSMVSSKLRRNVFLPAVKVSSGLNKGRN